MNSQVNRVQEIPKPIKLFWGSGALGVAVLSGGVSFLILFYMINILNIAPALAGTLIFASKIFDVISDPIVGIWSDRLENPKGRRRPFLLFGAIISALSFFLIFTTPIFDQQIFIAAYIFVALLLYTLGYTMFNVPYMAMPAEMTDSYHERSSIHAYRVVFVNIGGFLAGSVAPWVLEDLGKSEWSSYAVLAVAGGSIVLIFMSLAYFGTARAPFTTAGNSVPDLKVEFRAVLANKHFLRLISVKALQLLGVAASGSALIFFFVNALQLSLKDKAYFIGIITIVSIGSAPTLVALSKKIGKRYAYLLSAFCTILCASSWIFAEPNEPIALIMLRGAILGIAATGNILLAMSMLTDTIEYDAYKTGVRREGAYTSIYSFVEKTTFAFGPLIIGIALSLAGFDRDLPVDELQSPEVHQALLLGVSYLPSILGLLSMILIAGFKLDEKALHESRRESAS